MSRRNSSGYCGARTRACRVHTCVNAKQVHPIAPLRVSARPSIILNLRNQPGLDWIVFNVPSNPLPLTFIPHPVIIRLPSPKLLTSSSQQLICLPRRNAFEGLKQFTRRNPRKQKHVDMVGHNGKRSELVMTEFRTFEERIGHKLRDRVLLEKRWPGASSIQVPIHPDERFTRSALRGRRESRAWQTPVQVPGNEQPTILRINMRQPPLRVHTTVSVISPGKLSVAHALVRAVFALLRTQSSRRSHECERGTQECVRHGSVRHMSLGQRQISEPA